MIRMRGFASHPPNQAALLKQFKEYDPSFKPSKINYNLLNFRPKPPPVVFTRKVFKTGDMTLQEKQRVKELDKIKARALELNIPMTFNVGVVIERLPYLVTILPACHLSLTW